MTQTLTTDEMSEILKIHSNPLHEMYESSLAELNGLMNSVAFKFYNRNKSSLLQNIILEKAKPYFRENGVTVVEKYESALFGFPKGIVGRLKKLKKKTFLSSNLTTIRNSSLIQGTLFPDYPPHTLVEIGYIISPTWDSFEMIAVVVRKGNEATLLFEVTATEKQTHSIHSIRAREVGIQSQRESQIKKKGT